MYQVRIYTLRDSMSRKIKDEEEISLLDELKITEWDIFHSQISYYK